MSAASSLRYRPSGYLSAFRALAGLYEAVESETPYGGRAVSYEPLGQAWLKLGARRRKEREGPGGMVAVEAVTGEARADARLIEDRVLRFSGGDWKIVSVETVGGRAILGLERVR